MTIRNKAAILNIEVCFREVDALYDLVGSTQLVEDDQGFVTLREDTLPWLERGYISMMGLTRYIDVFGRVLDDRPDVPLIEGVYRSVRTQGDDPFPRTFVRRSAGAIDGKYVYVLRVGSRKSSGLIEELSFSRGRFRVCDPRSRNPTGPSRSKLVLELATLPGAGRSETDMPSG